MINQNDLQDLFNEIRSFISDVPKNSDSNKRYKFLRNAMKMFHMISILDNEVLFKMNVSTTKFHDALVRLSKVPVSDSLPSSATLMIEDAKRMLERVNKDLGI